jgi:hypothetical protein
MAVGGWLAFFIAALLAIGPIITIPSLLREFHLLEARSALSEGRFLVIAFDFAATIFLRLFGVYAGVKLWKLAPRAVHIAKRYLLSCGVYWTGVLSLTTATSVMGLISGAEAWRHVEHTALGLFSVALWYSYFEMSDRVAATYPHSQVTAKPS